jgi:hypothetical protein
VTTSTKRIRLYGDSVAGISRNDAARAHTGTDSWITQYSVDVVATSKREAAEIMESYGLSVGYLGLSVYGRVDPAHGETLHNSAEALRAAGLLTPDRVGACYLYGGQGSGGTVVDVTADGAPVIGHIRTSPGGWGEAPITTFVPLATSDHAARLREACDLLDLSVGDKRTPHRDALRLVLAAARSTLTEES